MRAPLRVGQILSAGRSPAAASYRLVERLTSSRCEKGDDGSAAFKAVEVPRTRGLSLRSSASSPPTVLIKAGPSLELKREHAFRSQPRILTSPSIVRVLDFIDRPLVLGDGLGLSPSPGLSPSSSVLVYEWMDQSLDQLSPVDHQTNIVFWKTVFEAGLKTLDMLAKMEMMHGAINPSNILISNPSSPHPIAKLTGLDGQVYDEPTFAHRLRAQPYAVWPPEAFDSRPPLRAPRPLWASRHRADVWSFAATLLQWLMPNLLGAADVPDLPSSSPHPDMIAHPLLPPENPWAPPWALAKLLRLFPHWAPQTASASQKRTAQLAYSLASHADPDDPLATEPLVALRPLSHQLAELVSVGVPVEVVSLLRYLLVVDCEKRPSPAMALMSEECGKLASAAEDTSRRASKGRQGKVVTVTRRQEKRIRWRALRRARLMKYEREPEGSWDCTHIARRS